MDTNKLAKIFKALSHPNRLEIYLRIARENQSNFDAGEECFVYDIIEKLKIGAPTVSHHLKELVNAGLIETERHGKLLAARANKEVLEQVIKILSF